MSDEPSPPSPGTPAIVPPHPRDVQLATMTAALNKFFADPEVKKAAQAFGQAVKEAADKARPILAFLESALIFGAALVEQMPAHLQKAFSELNDKGWFYDAEMPLPTYWNLKSKAAAQGQDLDAMMADHFESRLDDIERKLVAKLPNRASKLAPAFAAHRRGDFDLAILAFFAQTDGICKDLRGGYFFLNDRKGKPQTAGYAESFSVDELARIAHAALSRDLPIKQKTLVEDGIGAQSPCRDAWAIPRSRHARKQLARPLLAQLHRSRRRHRLRFWFGDGEGDDARRPDISRAGLRGSEPQAEAADWGRRDAAR